MPRTMFVGFVSDSCTVRTAMGFAVSHRTQSHVIAQLALYPIEQLPMFRTRQRTRVNQFQTRELKNDVSV